MRGSMAARLARPAALFDAFSAQRLRSAHAIWLSHGFLPRTEPATASVNANRVDLVSQFFYLGARDSREVYARARVKNRTRRTGEQRPATSVDSSPDRTLQIAGLSPDSGQKNRQFRATPADFSEMTW